MQHDRRRHRSDCRAEASRLYLAALRERTRSEAIVVADGDGLLVSGVGDGDLELLAALGEGAVPGASIHDLSVYADGTRLTVYSVGGAPPPPVETEHALTRILAA